MIAGISIAGLALLAPSLGLGNGEHFFLHDRIGLLRGHVLLLGVLATFAAVVIRTRGAAWNLLIDRGSRILHWLKSRWVRDDRVASPPSDDEAQVALVLVAILTGAFLVLTALPRIAPPRHIAMLPETIATYGFVDAGPQFSAHRFVLVALALAVFCAGWLRRQAAWFAGLGTEVPHVLGAAILLLPLLAWKLGLPVDYRRGFLWAAVFAACIWAAACAERVGWVRGIAVALAAAYLAALIVPGFTEPLQLIVDTPFDLTQVELHIAMVIQPSSMLAAGHRLFRDITPEYGVLVPTLLGSVERHAGLLDVGGQVRFTQLSQVAFLVLATVVLYRIRHRVLPALLPLAMVGPYLSSAGLALWHANQSGVRHLGFPIGLLALQIAQHWDTRRQALVLGFVGAGLLMLNFETGIALVCGFGFYLYLQSQAPRLRNLAAMLVWAVLGSIAAFALFVVIHRVGLGAWLTPSDLLAGLRHYESRLARNFSGSLLFVPGTYNENLAYVPLALVMVFHGSYLVLSSALRARGRRLEPDERFVAATSLVLLLWLGYYFNFPAWWNLWIPLFLYGAILTCLYDSDRLRAALARPIEILKRPWWALVVLLMLMVCGVSHVDLVKFDRGQLAPPWRSRDEGAMVSGVLVPTPLAGPLLEKADYLRRIARDGRVAYATLNADFMPVMSGVYQTGMQRNFFSLASSDDDIRRTVAEIAQSHVLKFLTDDIDAPLRVAEPRRSFQQRVRRIVAEYFVFVGMESGWDVWVPKTQ
jgi:hypothetical protein